MSDALILLQGMEMGETFALKVLWSQHSTLAQAMTCWQHGHLVGGQQRAQFHAGRRLDGFTQANVKALFAERLLQPG